MLISVRNLLKRFFNFKMIRKAVRQYLAKNASTLFPYIRRLDVVLSCVFGRIHEKEFRHLDGMLQKSPVVIDVGANLGQSITSLSRIFDNPQVICFECNPSCFNTLNMICELNKLLRGSLVTIHYLALSSEAGHHVFYVPRFHNNAFLQEGFLGTCNVEISEIAKRIGCRPDDIDFEKSKVEVATIDSFDLRPDLIKIDVQGAELDVLLGAKRTIINWAPVLFIEVPDDAEERQALLDYLFRIDYSVTELKTNLIAKPNYRT